MLVITRKEGQRVFIGDDIEVVVSRILPDGRVRLSIKAPRDVRIVREELLVSSKERNHVRTGNN